MKENNEIRSSAHSKYRCQYHIVFAPKFRRKEIYGKLKKDIGQILRKLCEQKNVQIIEAEACPDHIHMLVRGRQGDGSLVSFFVDIFQLPCYSKLG